MDIEFHAKKPKQLAKINAGDFCELLWWSYILGKSPEEIIAAIQVAGNSTEAVRKILKDRPGD